MWWKHHSLPIVLIPVEGKIPHKYLVSQQSYAIEIESVLFFIITAREWIEIKKWIIIAVTCVAVEMASGNISGRSSTLSLRDFGRGPPQGGSILLSQDYFF